MSEWGNLLEGIATLAWPLLILVLILRFAPAIRQVLESAKSRRFTVRVGGQELTMDELTEQQGDLIGDLQTQVALLQRAIIGGGSALESVARSPQLARPPRVLWVDDNPKNNSYFVQQLRNRGIEVDLALSTAEGLQLLDRIRPSVVVSDIGREEAGHYNQRAGLDLLRAVRQVDPDLPFALFASRSGVSSHKGEAEQLGANMVTSSATELTAFLQSHMPSWTR